MNIQILDTWLRDHLQTQATARQIAEKLSLTSVSIERVDPVGSDFLYDIEVTTNRPDLASVVGLAREAGAVLPQMDIPAKFLPPKLSLPKKHQKKVSIKIENDANLVNRVCAVIMEVNVKKSPKYISERLEAAGIRSLNNLIDITNYVMRTIGHPAHVFDFDRLATETLTIREAKKGEEITTLDNKIYTLQGGDIVAVNDKGDIIDLLGVMGLENSVVTDETKRILFFIDNNEPTHIRKTSMGLGIRTEAAQLNEKGLDPELAMDALLYGIKLYEELADGKVVSDIIDIYPHKPKPKTIVLSEEKMNTVIGVPVSLAKAATILTDLGFEVTKKEKSLSVTPPSFRALEMAIPEDLIEEVARVYGYHNIPSLLPPVMTSSKREDLLFTWETRVRNALKYWGFTEVYSYSMVSEELYDGPIEKAVTIANPLNEEFVYMRSSLILSLLQILTEHKKRETIKIFELANVYTKGTDKLPAETRTLAGVVKKKNISFYDIKGIVEQLASDMGIQNLTFKNLEEGSGARVFLGKAALGVIEVLDTDLVDFEMNFELLASHATMKKVYTPLPKYPPVVEDISLVVDTNIVTADILSHIKKHNTLISDVTLLDRYQDSRTFRITYQSQSKNLSAEDVTPIRESLIKSLKSTFQAHIK